jgi:hypothetical protein
MKRSVTTELQLEPGDYTVLLKIVAKRYPDDPTVEEVIAKTCQFRREKLLRIGLSYDLAHAKGGFRELEAEKMDTETAERRRKRKETAMKMHQARVTMHKKQKLRTMKTNWKKQEKALKKMTDAAEEQARQERQDKQEKHEAMERKLENFKFEEPEGLGIAVNGNGHHQHHHNVDPIKPPRRTDTPEELGAAPATGPPRPRTETWTSSPAMKHAVRPVQSRTVSSGSPYVGATPGRRDTLTIAPPVAIHSPGFGMPGIQVHRPSLSDGGRPTLSDISDDDLSWDSELDDPEDSDVEPDHAALDAYGYTGYPEYNSSNKKKKDVEVIDEFGKDPWNAVCVVGLRVYSKDSELRIDVERGTGKLKNGDTYLEDQQRGLDVDDASKDPSREPVSPSSGKDGMRGYAESSLVGIIMGR